jgi:prepilin-type N-terminal cleavage/methylation domain-containing protein
MQHKHFNGFTLVELVAAISVILILTGIVMVVANSGKEAAVQIRCKDAAATLNEAERNLENYRGRICPSLGGNPLNDVPTDPQARISRLQAEGFLANGIDASMSVVLTNLSNGCFRWLPRELSV